MFSAATTGLPVVTLVVTRIQAVCAHREATVLLLDGLGYKLDGSSANDAKTSELVANCGAPPSCSTTP